MAPIRRRQTLAALSAATVGLAGCTTARERLGDVRRGPPARRVDPGWRPEPGTWAEDEYGPANRRYNPHATPPRTEPDVDWRYDLGEPLEYGSLVVVDETVYVSTRNRLLALEAADGTARWERSVDGPSILKYVDGRLYELNGDFREMDLVARSLDGDETWRTPLPHQIMGVHEQQGYVFVAGRDRYWTLHADTGQIVRERDSWVRNVAAANGSVYAAFSGIALEYEVDGRTLAERWRAQSEYPIESFRPTVAEGLVYVPQYRPLAGEGEVVGYDPDRDQRRRIELEYESFALAVAEHGPVVAPTETTSGDLLALAPDGSRLWTADAGGDAGAIVADDTVFAGDPLVALDAESGERLWERPAIEPVRLAAAGSTLYAVTTDDHLLALRE